MSEVATTPFKEPTINFAIGPNCPVRCEGCYNHFGETFRYGGLVSADRLIDFALDASIEGVTQSTLSGGDPLFHPEIITISSGLKDIGMKIKLDTVGTTLLGAAPIVYKGRGIAPKVELNELAPHVDFMSIPLDGATQDTISKFRRGRAHLLTETRAVAGLLNEAGITFGFNTVANTANVTELADMLEIVEAAGASEWQIFEYDPNGPNVTNKRDSLRLKRGQFDMVTARLESTNSELTISCKNLTSRQGAYFLIDDTGLAWKPEGNGKRNLMGNITTDRKQVMQALRGHISELN